MEVQIISKGIIKPSASTPHHLQTYNLSLLDQLVAPLYIPVILFYSPTSESAFEKSGRLKKSLSEALTHFYPLAGRMKDDGSCVDCNDDGVMYVEAHVASDMSTVIQQPDIHQLQKLIPCGSYQTSLVKSAHILLAIQVNRFGCGGVAISASIWHGVADGASFGTFLTSWAAIARDASENIDEVILDCKSLFPPSQDCLLNFSLSDMFNEDRFRNSVMKRFVFDGSKIAALKEKIGDGPYLDCPSRVEALSALLWGGMMASKGEENENTKMNTGSLVHVVDIRKRMNPPLPQQSFGNICQLAVANWPKDEPVLDYNRLARKIHDSIKLISSDYVRKLHSSNELVDSFMKIVKEVAKNPNDSMFVISSWCKFPFYEVDFGWGKPTWVGCAMWVNNGCIFLDTRDGQGIEAWVGLSKKDMVKFEQNSDIIAYASFDPST